MGCLKIKGSSPGECGTIRLSQPTVLHEADGEQRLWHRGLAALCRQCTQVLRVSYSKLNLSTFVQIPTVQHAGEDVFFLNIHFALLSTGRLELVPGSPLQVFLEATEGLSPEERADRLENDAEIVRVHDEAAREGQTAAPNLEDQVFLFLEWTSS